MPGRQLHALIPYIRRLAGPEPVGGLTDGQLLERYLSQRDQAAFEVLLWRHGPMVLGTCRRLLRQTQDIEDAFQATFLVFARKAGSVRRGGGLGGWLHRVAYRLALRTRTQAAKRALHEEHSLISSAAEPAAEMPDALWWDVRRVLDEEISGLPERYRLPFVLCHLEGRTNEEAARELGCPVGTVLSRLSRARQWLRDALVRRGVTLSAGALALVLAEKASAATLPALLAESTLKAALPFAAGQLASAATSHATVLAEGVIRAMFMTKLQVVGALVIAAATVGVGAGAIRQNGAVPVSRKEAQETRPAPVDNKARSALVEVPSLRGGQILFIATEVADPNQSVRVEDRKLYFQKRVPFIARLVRQGEKIPDGEKIGVRSEGDITVYSIRPKPHELPIDFFEVKQGKDTKLYRRVQKAEELQPNRVIVGLETKWFRNLRPGDAVRRDQLLAVLDTTSAFDEVAIRVKKFNGKEADRIASEKTRDEAQARLRTIERLRRNGVNIAEEEYRQNKLTYERYFHDELSKKAEVQIAELELARNLNALRQHEIRSPSDGVIKTILKHPGEAVKALETILRIEPSEEP